MTYNPMDWYWEAKDGDVFSSKRNAVVDTTDTVYVAWKEIGNEAARWPEDESGIQTWSALQEVLTPYGLGVPQVLTKRQFYQAITKTSPPFITEAEAIAAMAGTLPTAIENTVNSLPADNRFEARMLLIGAQSFIRTDPLVALFQAANSLTDTQVDDIWKSGNSL